MMCKLIYVELNIKQFYRFFSLPGLVFGLIGLNLKKLSIKLLDIRISIWYTQYT